jgi:hypothetical protein
MTKRKKSVGKKRTGSKSKFAATVRKHPNKFPAKTVAWAKKH